MDVLSFLYVSLGSSTVQVREIYVADMMHHVQRLVSVLKMATSLEECTTKKQHSVVCSFAGKRTQCKGCSYGNDSCLRWEVSVM
jgi:hypothetical protein